MSRMSDENLGRYAPVPGSEERGRFDSMEREDHGGGPSGLLLAGLVVVGLGAVAWYYLGPDLRRYMKMRSM